MTDQELAAILYDACLRAALEMGDDLRGLSCFMTNWAASDRKIPIQIDKI
ncbi:MAG: hypothetical protein JWQ03_1003, partial [Variovorax sp.]|nr:hypothetical protein [Variovorax sp.]